MANVALQKKYLNNKKIYVIFSLATKHPFVVCDEETFDDKVFCFTKTDLAEAMAKKLKDEKYKITVGTIEGENNILGFLRSLALLGINAVEYDGEETDFVSEIFDVPDMQALNAEPIPKANTGLMITSMYFLQAVRKEVKPEKGSPEMAEIVELEEEMLVNVARSTLILGGEVVETDGKEQVRIPMLKNNDGKEFMPFHVSLSDFNVFASKQPNAKDKKYKLKPVKFEEILNNIPPQAEGILINPAGLALVLTRKNIERIINKNNK